MKNIIIFILSAFFSFALIQAHAQKKDKVTTETIEVKGTCGMCKKRIEKAAYGKGVKRVEWNKENHQLTVTYNSQQTSIGQISENIAKVGHDANGVTADTAAFEALPACCNYRTGASCGHAH